MMLLLYFSLSYMYEKILVKNGVPYKWINTVIPTENTKSLQVF